MRTSSAELLIELERSRARGFRAQVEDELREAIRSGRLAPGALLPSTRALAADLGVTRGVIVAAYDQLVAEGYLASRPGSGTVVNATAKNPTATRRRPRDDTEIVVDFRPGLPDLDLFPRAAWLRATRTALQTLPAQDLGYTDPRGLPQLREALADYLGRVRGVSTDSDHVVVCNGFAHGLGLVARALHDTGRDVFAVENPGHPDPRAEIEWLGARCRGIDVDAEGIVVDQLRASRARAVVLTPAHQFPTGAVLSAAPHSARDMGPGRRRLHRRGRLRRRVPLRPPARRGPPGRRAGPGDLQRHAVQEPGARAAAGLARPACTVARTVVARRQVTDHATSSLVQAACAAFLTNGDLDRHLRRTRRVYRRRRDALIAALARWVPDARPERRRCRAPRPRDTT